MKTSILKFAGSAITVGLDSVLGGGGSCPPPPCYCPPPPAKKGNNGFGNGADANRAAPGNSGTTGGGKEGSFGDDRGER